MSYVNLEALVMSPALWSEYAVSDAARTRLEDVLSELLCQGGSDPVWMARAGHVLMMLGKPREACELLGGFAHRLCRAQALLAEVQVARKERSFVLLGKIVSHVKHFGMASNPLELEAQMRLDFALGCAYDLLQIEDQRTLHYERTLTVAHLIGVKTMPGVVNATLSVARSEIQPEAHAKRLGLLAVEQAAGGNVMLGIDLARQSVELLMGIGDYPSIADLAPRWQAFLPESAEWAYAARLLLDPYLPAPAFGVDVLRHPLPLLAQTRQQVTLSLRHAERLRHSEARSLAIAALRNPYWPHGATRGDAQLAFLIMKILAHVVVGNTKSARNMLAELVHEEWQHVAHTGLLYIGVTALELYSRGLDEVPGLSAQQAIIWCRKGLKKFAPAFIESVMSILTGYTPNAMAFLAQFLPEAREALEYSAVYLQPDYRVKFAGKALKGFPHGAYELIRGLVEEERSSDPRRAVTATRVAAALDSVPQAAVAYRWRVEHLNTLIPTDLFAPPCLA